MLLREFIAQNREELLARARLRVADRNAPRPTKVELTEGLPVFLDQLGEALRKATAKEAVDHEEIERTATKHGDDLFRQGVTLAQVVHDYGDLCQVITGFAVEAEAPIEAEEFQTLNLCLDDAIAGAVTEWSRQRERVINDASTERLGVLAHEMRNLLSTALMTFDSIKAGTVSPAGSTGAMHQRSLMGLLTLVDRSLAEVRLEASMQSVERIALWEVVVEAEILGTILAKKRGLSLAVECTDGESVVCADRQILTATVANLLQNALKFTHDATTITLRASSTTTRVLIDIEDECGGLPEGKRENLLRPFTQGGPDRSGLGLGLSICAKAVKAMDGELRVQNLPGKGCIFTIDLPKQPPSP